MNSFYSEAELEKIGFKRIGQNVKISKKSSFYSAKNMTIGDNVRIDDFCILSGTISIGNNVHISAYCALYGKYGIEINDYSGCSARTIIYSETDDFSGEYMIGAIIPDEYKNIKKGKVILEKYTQLGSETIVMPNIIISEGAVTGAMTFVNKDLEEWSINVGIPVRRIKERKKDLLKYINEYEKLYKN